MHFSARSVNSFLARVYSPIFDFSLKLCVRFNAIRMLILSSPIDHFTVVCSVTWPLHGSEAGGDLALIQTSRHLSCK